MKRAPIKVFGVLILIAACATQSISPRSYEQAHRIVIAVSTVLDGKGQVLKNTRIVVEGSKVVAIDPNAGPVDYDLHGLTVLPGWIDSHVHITWSFDKDGRNQGQGVATPQATLQSAANA